ncbi:hypothetical protein CA11_09920 [Gimesia maris]|nr:hypothetical protein CA11_09920 [Gimesia maris]
MEQVRIPFLPSCFKRMKQGTASIENRLAGQKSKTKKQLIILEVHTDKERNDGHIEKSSHIHGGMGDTSAWQAAEPPKYHDATQYRTLNSRRYEMRISLILTSLIALTVIVSPVEACPYCKSEIGKEVAAGIFNDDFILNAVLTLLPVPILLSIVYVINSGIPFSKNNSKENASQHPDSRTTLVKASGAEHD